MRTVLTLSILLLTLLVSPLIAEKGDGYFECRIKEAYSVSIKDGVFKEYNSIIEADTAQKINYSYITKKNNSKFRLVSISDKGIGFDSTIYLKKPSELPEDLDFINYDKIAGSALSNEKNLIGV